MSAREIRAQALALLGEGASPIIVLGGDAAPWTAAMRAGGRTPAGTTEEAAAVLVSFVGERGDGAWRRTQLAVARARLRPDAPLVLVDHNWPRQWWCRPLAALTLALRGLPPSRGRYPAARELDAAGFRVERLQLAAGERVQLVLARREAGAS